MPPRSRCGRSRSSRTRAGVADTADPLGGSYYIEALTDELEARALELIARIDELGGAVAAIEAGFVQAEIEAVGVRVDTMPSRPGDGDRRRQRVRRGRGSSRSSSIGSTPQSERARSSARGRSAPAATGRGRARRSPRVRESARGAENMLPSLREALRALCTVGEICTVLREEWGMYDRRRC